MEKQSSSPATSGEASGGNPASRSTRVGAVTDDKENSEVSDEGRPFGNQRTKRAKQVRAEQHQAGAAVVGTSMAFSSFVSSKSASGTASGHSAPEREVKQASDERAKKFRGTACEGLVR